MRKGLSLILIVLGIILLIFFAGTEYLRRQPNNLSFSDFHPQTTSSLLNQTRPVEVLINSIGVDLPVFPAKIEGERWEETDKGISYLTTSTVPGQIGNSIFYGHDFPNLLGNLKNVKIGDEIVVFMENRKVLFFQVEKLAVVSPNDTSVLDSDGTTKLTVYTCTGFLDSKRFVVTAKPLH